MQKRFLHLPLIAAVILLASCGQSNTQGKLIPQNAAFVIHVDGKSLSSKLQWEDIKQKLKSEHPPFLYQISDQGMRKFEL